MRFYVVDNNHIKPTYVRPKSLPAESVLLQTRKDLDTRRFSVGRLTALYNALPRVEPVSRFASRAAAIRRFWSALEALPVVEVRDSKQSRMIALMRRGAGASVSDLCKATGWQPHSVRGVVSGTLRKKMKLDVVLQATGNDRVYRIAD